jgi:hypothetical protein
MSTVADPKRLERLVPAIAESARAAAPLAPTWSDDLLWLAGFLEGVAAAPTLAAPPPSKPKRARAVTGAQIREAQDRALNWINDYRAAWTDAERIPSARAILKAAKGTGISRVTLLASRPPEWQPKLGAPIK